MADDWRLLALPSLDAGLLRTLFADLPVEVVVPAEHTQAAALAAAAGAEILVGDWGGLQVDADLVGAADRLAFVQQPSVGLDSVDVEACTAAGIPVANAGDANAVSVVEWCLGATFAVLRSLAWGDAQMRARAWPQFDLAPRGGGELTGRRVGIIGMGRIGRLLATRFTALGADVAHWSRHERDAADAGGARWLPFDDLLAHAQVLVVVVALTPQTRGLLGTEQLAALPDGAFVVNAARGQMLDEAALLAAIESGHLAGAALDVFAREPLPADSPLRTNDRVLLSPHAAGTTSEAQLRLIGGVVDNVRRAVTGEPVRDLVNDVEAVVRRR